LARRICPTPQALEQATFGGLREQMTDGVRQDKLAVERSETCSSVLLPAPTKKECALLFYFSFFHHFLVKKCLFKKLFPTELTVLFLYDIVALRDKNKETFNEKIYCLFALLDHDTIADFM
jgi:hypothetical protein